MVSASIPSCLWCLFWTGQTTSVSQPTAAALDLSEARAEQHFGENSWQLMRRETHTDPMESLLGKGGGATSTDRASFVQHSVGTSEVTISAMTNGAVSEPACVDTPGWTNIDNLTCSSYAHLGFCRIGLVRVGKEWTMGSVWNYPEQNCCACGKSVSSAPQASASAPADDISATANAAQSSHAAQNSNSSNASGNASEEGANNEDEQNQSVFKRIMTSLKTRLLTSSPASIAVNLLFFMLLVLMIGAAYKYQQQQSDKIVTNVVEQERDDAAAEERDKYLKEKMAAAKHTPVVIHRKHDDEDDEDDDDDDDEDKEPPTPS